MAPPDVHPDEDAVVALVQNTVAADKQEDLFGLLERMGNYHPEESHWFCRSSESTRFIREKALDRR